jgi:LmbE family N-acetylglucosaminyl deacetylase
MSFGIYNTKEEIDRFFEILTNLAQGKYDLSKYQLNKKSGEYYTVEHLQTMGKFLKSIEENVFGLSSEEKIISEADQELYEFIERFHNEREKLLTQGQELLDEYRSTLKEGITISFRNLYQNYLDAKERLSSLPYRFAVWVLKDFPRSTGKRHIVFIQRGSSALGYLMKDLAKELGWNHLKFHDLYMNSKIAGHLAGYMMGTLPISEMKANGNNTYEEIFEYVAQENLLDGAPIVFIDTGMIGSNPWLLRKLIHNPSLWRHSELPFKKIDISTRLFFLNSHGKEEEIRFAHENQVEGFNEAADAPHDQIDLLNDFNHSYGIASFLDKGVKYPYDRPERLIWKEEPSGKKIEPLLVPNDAFTQLVALSQRLAAEDLIRERVVQNDPLLKEFATTSTPSISDDQTILLSEQSIDGVSTQALPKNKRIAVIEQTENDAMAYAGNLVKRLEKENKIQKFSLRDLELLADFTNFLKKFKPDFILLPQGRSDLEAMIQDIVEETGREITILSYVSLDLLPFQNFFFPFSAQTAQVVKKAIQTHKSQVTRTAYDQIFEYSSQVAGQKLQFYQPAMEDSPYAQAFRVGFIHQGKVEITSNDTRYKIGPARAPYTINLSDDIPLLVISPHADDLEIAAGGLIRSYLEASQRPSRTRVLNWVIGTGDEWGVIFEPDHPTADLTEDAQIGIKRHIRREEALEAGSVLSKETSGKLEVSVFGLLSASQHPQRANVILPMNTPQVFKDLRYLQMKLNDFYHEYISLFKNEEMLTVILPHPDDAHPHHQMATKIVLEALSQLSIAQGISIQLLFYSSPWAGSFNTYYVSNKNQTLDETVSVDLKDKISIAEKAKRSLGIIIGELFAGFGKKPLSSEALGGSFAERFMRKTIRPTVASQKQINLPLPAPQTLQPEDSQNIFESAA